MYREGLSPSPILGVSEVFSACPSSTSLRWPSWVWALSKNARWCATMLSPSDPWPTSPSLTITESSMELWPRSFWATLSRPWKTGRRLCCKWLRGAQTHGTPGRKGRLPQAGHEGRWPHGAGAVERDHACDLEGTLLARRGPGLHRHALRFRHA